MKNFQLSLNWIKKRKFLIILAVLFLFELFFKTYQLDIKNPFGYDQVDNAWAAKNFIVNHNLPLLGMVAKASSGIYIGPLYYWFASIFYYLFNLNPFSSMIIAVVSSIFTFWTIYYIFSKLVNNQFALIALFINVFSLPVILFDRIQWPVQLFPTVSLFIFYFLYKVITGDVKKIIPLALFTGIAFNLHFTAIFFPIIIFLSLPFFSKTKEALRYILMSFPLFLLFLVPNLIYSSLNKGYSSNFQQYLSTYSHGFHLRRMLQIIGDAFIQFDPYLIVEKLKPIKIFIIPIFALLYLHKNINTKSKKFLYIVALWFLVPWFVFTIYSGEISDYYFIVNKFIVLFALTFFAYKIWNMKFIIAKIFLVFLFLVNAYYTINNFLPYKDIGSLKERNLNALSIIKRDGAVDFQQGVPESYIYWYYMWKKGVNVY